MKTYKEIFKDFRNTTRLNIRLVKIMVKIKVDSILKRYKLK